MGRQRIHQPYSISFGREKTGDNPWALSLELFRHTGRGLERVRHVFSEGDLKALRVTLALLKPDRLPS